MTVIYILVMLFVALIIIVPLLERTKVRMSDQQMSKISRWILPLVMILIIGQLLLVLFSG